MSSAGSRECPLLAAGFAADGGRFKVERKHCIAANGSDRGCISRVVREIHDYPGISCLTLRGVVTSLSAERMAGRSHDVRPKECRSSIEKSKCLAPINYRLHSRHTSRPDLDL